MKTSPPAQTLTLEIDPSLLEQVHRQLERARQDIEPEAYLATLVTTILDNSSYPIRASRTDSGDIKLTYHLRSFSEPFM
ncbi:MAG: hypothetical protein GVY22_02765 [Gammaproteobacteria bacterium]|jgi:hypothetical protein|nr:hypothetical protein [Gammaproteobacteria bacterium]